MNVIRNTDGQSTLEFALVGAGFLSIVVALGILWRSLESGLFVEHALASASHHVSMAFIGVMGDVFLY